MNALYFKTIINLFKGSISELVITPTDTDTIIINQKSDFINDLQFFFKINTVHNLRYMSYTILISSIYSIIKNVSKASVIHFEDNGTNLIVRISSDLTDTFKLPLITTDPALIENMVEDDDAPIYTIKSSLFNRITKNLCNTSQKYHISVFMDGASFSNIESIIPRTLTVGNTTRDTSNRVNIDDYIITNTTLQRLTRFGVLTKTVDIGSSFISGEGDGLKFYLKFL